VEECGKGPKVRGNHHPQNEVVSFDYEIRAVLTTVSLSCLLAASEHRVTRLLGSWKGSFQNAVKELD